jgi:hypothetical protein
MPKITLPKVVFLVIRTTTPTLVAPSYEIKQVFKNPRPKDKPRLPTSPDKKLSYFITPSTQWEGSVHVLIERNIDAPVPDVIDWDKSMDGANSAALIEQMWVEGDAAKRGLKKKFSKSRDSDGRFLITETHSEEVDDLGDPIDSVGTTVWFETVRVDVDENEVMESASSSS